MRNLRLDCELARAVDRNDPAETWRRITPQEHRGFGVSEDDERRDNHQSSSNFNGGRIAPSALVLKGRSQAMLLPRQHSRMSLSSFQAAESARPATRKIHRSRR